MNLKKWIKVALIVGSVATLAACSRHTRDANAINEANAAYSNDAESSGLGEESNFGDQSSGGGRHLAKRTYYFDYDSNVVHSNDKPAIEANANYLSGHQNAKVMLEGHTDPRGSREYNIGLGERRAKSVAEILISNGVNPGQIRVVSYGAEKLAAPGHSESDYQQDRRVVLAYLQR